MYHQFISNVIDENSEKFIHISDQIWEYSEIGFQEYQSTNLLCSLFEEEGFEVKRNIEGIETSFVASFGSGKPIIAFLGEYDALSGLSQKAGVTTKEPDNNGENGHGCGHNLLGTAALSAALAVRDYMVETGQSGTIRYYGCPAEEGGSGKVYMIRDGVFNDVDVALTWHPYDQNLAFNNRLLATCGVDFKFTGKSAHAAIAPHLGRSALDAVELMNIGTNFLREHIIPEARIHYAITNTGGYAPNVVQSEAEVRYLIRAPQTKQIREIYERVCDIAKGAALMTGTKMEHEIKGASAELIPNVTLSSIMHENFEKVGTTKYRKEEYEFAQAIQQSFSEEEKKVIKVNGGRILSDSLEPFSSEVGFFPGSTDVCDVSWIVPTGQIYVSICAFSTPFHSWQLVAQGKTSIAHKGMLTAGKVLACTAIDLFLNEDKLQKVKSEHKKQLNGEKYQTMIPDDKKIKINL